MTAAKRDLLKDLRFATLIKCCHRFEFNAGVVFLSFEILPLYPSKFFFFRSFPRLRDFLVECGATFDFEILGNIFDRSFSDDLNGIKCFFFLKKLSRFIAWNWKKKITKRYNKIYVINVINVIKKNITSATTTFFCPFLKKKNKTILSFQISFFFMQTW